MLLHASALPASADQWAVTNIYMAHKRFVLRKIINECVWFKMKTRHTKVTAWSTVVNERIKQQIWRQSHTLMNALLEYRLNEIVSGQQLENKRFTRGKYKASFSGTERICPNSIFLWQPWENVMKYGFRQTRYLVHFLNYNRNRYHRETMLN